MSLSTPLRFALWLKPFLKASSLKLFLKLLFDKTFRKSFPKSFHALTYTIKKNNKKIMLLRKLSYSPKTSKISYSLLCLAKREL